MTPSPQMGGLIHELKAAGYGIYLLTNAGPTFEEYRARIPAIECFDGVLVSCYEHMVKPDAPIYQLLCTRYELDPASCLYVDDLLRNVVGAQRAGMQGYVFDGDVDAFLLAGSAVHWICLISTSALCMLYGKVY